ncbi:DUF4192 domain-containing protein [Nocardioides sp. 31GB23]|uniref:N-acetylglutamate synthase-like GNAT family acetyltransferase n=1 Tax=Nocardioides salarius TaxID=374513 RepID=A0ABS2MG46_9ACTN|nr:DUF4192 domain-containing protein [Nocardioides salarius]MBM7510162.1 N-acetylglutamate synthase-like GNAT family acetyltransferase [Nocardioides salarius]
MTFPEMPSPSAPPHGFVARDPADVLAVVPVLLGFEPEDCVVMLTFGAEHQFHARLDLPPADASDARVAELAGLLVEPAVRHHVSGVLLVVYSDEAERARRSARCLVDAFSAAGITVLRAIRADGERHWPATGPGEGTAYDVSAHPVRVQAVLDGHVTRRSRADLAATLDPDGRGRADVARALDHRPALTADEVSTLLLSCLATGSVPGPHEVAGLVRAVADPVVRDVAWLMMTRQDADRHVVLWSDVVRRTPDEWLPGAAAVLGFAAWLSGSGALAWCALDRCLSVDPDHILGGYVAQLLERAVPPHAWAGAGRPA